MGLQYIASPQARGCGTFLLPFESASRRSVEFELKKASRLLDYHGLRLKIQSTPHTPLAFVNPFYALVKAIWFIWIFCLPIPGHSKFDKYILSQCLAKQWRCINHHSPMINFFSLYSAKGQAGTIPTRVLHLIFPGTVFLAALLAGDWQHELVPILLPLTMSIMKQDRHALPAYSLAFLLPICSPINSIILDNHETKSLL